MLIAFLDTNILLHFPPVAELDWCKLLGDSEVTLMYCLPVIDEMDEKKIHPSLGERAKKRLSELRGNRNKEVRPGVTVKVYAYEPAKDEGDTDKRILLCAKKFQEESGRNVVVVTGDHGMELRAEQMGITVRILPDDLQLPNPQSEDQRKLRDANKRIAEIENKLPQLKVFSSRVRFELRRPTPISINEKLEECRKRIFDNFGGQRHID